MEFVRLIKTVMPAVVVLVAGLYSINFIYNNYMKDGASTVITLEPAAGEDAAASVEETTTQAVEEHAMEAAPVEEMPAVEGMVEDVVVDCVAAEDAAKAAEGTDGAEAAAAAVAECHAAKAAHDGAEATMEGHAMEAAPVEEAPAVEGEVAPE